MLPKFEVKQKESSTNLCNHLGQFYGVPYAGTFTVSPDVIVDFLLLMFGVAWGRRLDFQRFRGSFLIAARILVNSLLTPYNSSLHLFKSIWGTFNVLGLRLHPQYRSMKC